MNESTYGWLERMHWMYLKSRGYYDSLWPLSLGKVDQSTSPHSLMDALELQADHFTFIILLNKGKFCKHYNMSMFLIYIWSYVVVKTKEYGIPLIVIHYIPHDQHLMNKMSNPSNCSKWMKGISFGNNESISTINNQCHRFPLVGYDETYNSDNSWSSYFDHLRIFNHCLEPFGDHITLPCLQPTPLLHIVGNVWWRKH